MNISIRHLLRVGLLLGSIIGTILFFLTVKNVFDHSEQMLSSVTQMRVVHHAAIGLEVEIERQHELVHQAAITPNESHLEDFVRESQQIRQRIFSLEEAVEHVVGKRTIQSLNRQYDTYLETSRAFLQSPPSDADELALKLRHLDTLMSRIELNLNRLHSNSIQLLDESSDALQETLFKNAAGVFGVLVFALVMLWAYFFVADSKFLRPTRSLVEATNRVAEGHFDSGVNPSGASEIRHLGESFNTMLERLKDNREHINELTESLERKVAERTAELVESQDYLDRIIYGSPVGVAIFDSDGVLRDCNVALATMLGKDSREECVDVISVSDADAFGNNEFRWSFDVAKQGEVIRTEPMQIDDVGRQWFSHHFVPYYSRKGTLTRIICYSVDVSIEKTARDQLVEKNKELESFIYSVSHDLKAPLFTISGLASILKTEKADTVSERQKELIDRILSNMKHMEALINDLLDLSRAGANPEKFTTFAPGEVVRIAFLEEKVRHNVPANLQLHDGLPEITADQALIGQLFRNLISNSFKYRSNERKLEISLSSGRVGREVTFRYRDNGQGIAPQSLGKVFEVFYSTAGPEQDGSGVGLTIVKRIVESHGGRITVQSQPEEGTEFIFTLPVQ